MTAKKICKICGREYDYCKTNRPVDIFRWQDVACSPEHGSIYFERIIESRKETIPSPADSIYDSDTDNESDESEYISKYTEADDE